LGLNILLGIVLVAHGELPQTFLSVAEQMLGKQQFIECVSYNIGDDLETLRYKIATAIKQVDRGSGIIMLTDMFGGVPSNIAISVGYSQKTEVISGMNLSMLLKLITIRTSVDLKTATSQTKEIGTKYIYVLSELLADA
jgi:mannose PTS system EIIA component